ncbi:MAG: glutathione S-transferase family protein [Planctomycetia bacterium]|nr:glutathione S-transferase family protein [Planctomycetia bacterium]
MIKLYSFGRNSGVADASPFVLKVDAYMRMAGIQFENIAGLENLRKAPKGKLPFIDDNGKIIADSQVIIDHFKQIPEQDLDKDLTDEQRATAYLVTKSLDENLYFVLLYFRWYVDANWIKTKQAFFSDMPVPLKYFVPGLIRKQVIKALKGQGVSRHTNEEIQQILRSSLQSLSDLLGSRDYFFGDKPSSLDATAFAILAEFILVDQDDPHNQIAREYAALVAYCDRINAEFY